MLHGGQLALLAEARGRSRRGGGRRPIVPRAASQGARRPRDEGVAGRGEEADVSYRVWVRSWVLREEMFDDRNGAELFRLKLEASCPTLGPSDVVVVPEQPATRGALPAQAATA